MTEPHNSQSAALVKDTSAASSVVGLPLTDEIDRMARLAGALAKSGYFTDAHSTEQAFAKLLFGRDLGLGATQALTDIHIVEGKPQLSANLQASLLREHPDYDYRAAFGKDADGPFCEIVVLKRGQEVGRERFSWADAQQAGLVDRNKHTWAKYPRNMLFARAISNAVAFHAPEVTRGVRTYGPGEIDGNIEPEQIAAGHGEPIQDDDPIGNPAEPIDAEVIEETDAERLLALADMVGFKAAANALSKFLGFESVEACAAAGHAEAFERVLSAASELPDQLDPQAFVNVLRGVRGAADTPDALATAAVSALVNG